MATSGWRGKGLIGCGMGWVFAAALALVLLPARPAVGQTVPGAPALPGAPTSNQGRLGTDPASPLNAPNPLAGPNAAKLEHMREDERRKRLESDTAKLVELTNQLKADVDKASKDELSLDVVRKAAEIEKLAHDVKERMKS